MLPYRQSSRNEIVTSLLAKIPVPLAIAGLESSRTTIMDRRGEGVGVILGRGEAHAGRPPSFEMLGESELMLTIFAAPGPTEV